MKRMWIFALPGGAVDLAAGVIKAIKYYGGGYYGEMLKAVYPQIKAVNLQSQVHGWILLDCDRLFGGCAAVGAYLAAKF